MIQFRKTKASPPFSIQLKAQSICKALSSCASCRERNWYVVNTQQLFSISSCFCSNQRRERVKHLFTCQTGQKFSKRKMMCLLKQFSNFMYQKGQKKNKELISVQRLYFIFFIQWVWFFSFRHFSLFQVWGVILRIILQCFLETYHSLGDSLFSAWNVQVLQILLGAGIIWDSV